jgi:hypothetical protein
VTAEDEGHPDGVWPGEKDEQSQAYARRATGDYLWQVDIDEFYRAEDIERIRAILQGDPTITGMCFKQITFWGGLDYTVDGWYLRRGATWYHRLFRWGSGYRYTTHRPPTVVDADGVDAREGHYLCGRRLDATGIRLYHYSLLFPKQVLEKCDYYGNAEWARREHALRWAQESFLTLGHPYRVHNVYDHPSWLERYRGDHPDEVLRMMADLRAAGSHELRPTDDIEHLLASQRYRFGRALLKAASPLEAPAERAWRHVRRRLHI